MKKILLAISITAVVLTGCSEITYNESINPNWQSFNEEHDETHVSFAYSDETYYSDGCLLGNMLYSEWRKRAGE